MVKSFCKKAEVSCEQQLAAAKQEIEDIRRRTDDYIHEAKLMIESTEAQVKSKIWAKLQPHIIEVLDSEEVPEHLTKEQKFFHRRLLEIKEALRDLGIPPGA